MAQLSYPIKIITCPNCLGSGIRPLINNFNFSIKKQLRRPTLFDLDCCLHCEGEGEVLLYSNNSYIPINLIL